MTIVLLKDDLRLHDNPALFYASQKGPVFVVYVLPKKEEKSRCADFLYNALRSFQNTLKRHNQQLIIRKGDPATCIYCISKETKCSSVYFNGDTFSHVADVDFISALHKKNLFCQRFSANLLTPLQEILTKKNTPVTIFSNFVRTAEKCLDINEVAAPAFIDNQKQLFSEAIPLAEFPILATEERARELLAQFVQQKEHTYDKWRDFPAHDAVSHLSAFIRFGLISIRTVWNATKSQSFHRELLFRDYAHHLFDHFPTMNEKNMRAPKVNWHDDKEKFHAWAFGKTGIPFVDAGMRELLATGYMHNRARMVIASYLTKNLKISWKLGAQWFMDHLLDADVATNSYNWQYIAGTACNSPPYERMYNPERQQKRFDPDALYTKQYMSLFD